MARGGRGGPEMREGGRNIDETVVNRLMQFDKNADGKLAKDEVPERMQAIFERGEQGQGWFPEQGRGQGGGGSAASGRCAGRSGPAWRRGRQSPGEGRSDDLQPASTPSAEHGFGVSA